MKIKLLHIATCLWFVLTFLAIQSKAQSYRTAIGVRAGTELGLTLQQKFIGTSTFEGILTTNKYRWQAQGLFEYHRPVLGKRFNIYMGAGPHYGNEKGYGNYWGITPIVGIEMTMFKLVISYDYKPSININGGSGYIFHDSGVSVRMVIVRKKRKTPIKNFFEKIKKDK